MQRRHRSRFEYVRLEERLAPLQLFDHLDGDQLVELIGTVRDIENTALERAATIAGVHGAHDAAKEIRSLRTRTPKWVMQLKREAKT